jgi:hypothetical protein
LTDLCAEPLPPRKYENMLSVCTCMRLDGWTDFIDIRHLSICPPQVGSR